MSKILFAVVALCFAQIVVCRVARESAPATTENPWLEALNVANETIEQFHRSFLSLAGVNSDDELWDKAKGQFNVFQTNVENGIDNLRTETKPLQGKAADLYKGFIAKVTEITNELKTKNPELFSGDAKQLQAVGERAFRTIVDESQKLRTKLEKEGHAIQPKAEELIKSIQDAAVQTAKDFKTQADATINSIQKKN